MKQTLLNMALLVCVSAVLFAGGCITSEILTEGTGFDTASGDKGTVFLDSFDPTKELSTNAFKSVTEFQAFVKENRDNGYYYGGVVDFESVEMSVPVAETSVASGSAKPQTAARDYSETNNQVASVDEADILKTDGNYIYTVTDNTVYIVKAYPGEDAEVVSTIQEDNRPSGLFIEGNYLAVFGNFYDVDFFDEIDFQPRQGMTFFTIYDMSDKENPEVVKEYKFEGNYFQARLYDGYVYFVTTTGPEYRMVYPTPVIIEDDVVSSIAVEDIHYFPLPYNNPQFANIHSMKLSDIEKDVQSKTITVEGRLNMYMSEENMFLTYTEQINEWQLQQEVMIELMKGRLTDADKALVKKIEDADMDLLSKQEKQQKILQIIESYVQYLSRDDQEALQDKAEQMLKDKLAEYEYFEYTIINKVGLDNGEIEVKANGKVPGALLNQFSLDEYDDVLRVATTINQRWSRFDNGRQESTNNVFTLDKNLKQLDSLQGLAEGERIFSTRFMGEKLYMVTFRQVDPFFVIDLQDARNIKALGELKIPGFSRYLQAYDENIIVGIGREATETGRQQGLKISLFDVSDVSNPKEIAKFVSDERYAQSTAEYEHKAFLMSKEKNLLVIPAYNYDYYDDEEGYNGAMVFKITKDSIKLRGIVDHSKGEEGYYYSPTVERSLYIEELLYTKSPNLLRINTIEDLGKVKNVELKQGSKYEIY